MRDQNTFLWWSNKQPHSIPRERVRTSAGCTPNIPHPSRFFFPKDLFTTSPRGPNATRAPAAQSSHTRYARREARGGDSAESARTSLSKGDSPSTLAVLEIGKESKLAAKDLAAATDNNPTITQRRQRLLLHAAEGGQCVPVLEPTTGRSWPLPHTSVRQTRCLGRPSGTATPARTPGRCVPCFGELLPKLRRRGAPADVSGETRVVSTAS